MRGRTRRMQSKDCIICKKSFKIERDKLGKIIAQRIYCSKRCSDKSFYLKNKEKYLKNKEKYIEAARRDERNPKRKKKIAKKACEKFRKDKPERFNELMRKGYKKNKNKWQSRKSTLQLLNRKSPEVFLEKKCKRCGELEELEIHHEEYPDLTREIKKAINEGKIYYLCKKCHGRGKNHG